jgi:hypothetical protein
VGGDGVKEPRAFIKVHDDIEDHPKVAPLSDAAFRLLVTSWGWCHRYNTDGNMPSAVWSRRGAAKARGELLRSGLACEDGNEVVFHDYLEHQQSAEQRQAAREQRRSAGQAGGLARSKRLASGSLSDSPSEIQAEVEVEKEKNMSAVADAPIRSDVEGLCRYFALAISRNGAKATITEKWRTEARLLLDKDEREPSEIRSVIDWSTSDSFWRVNVLSVPKLREKYDQLRLAMQRENPRPAHEDPHKEHLSQW